ncbi:hypothetical protein KY290_031038 [Solanum tuberosum]|uniref:Uncharacterized protein n=1 Tax=Solanum tuberosum TaxID=4113 RepID=A0ABQ7UBH3_SOLTU|nr:hypothetical protein KY290_031038 [Solanum tuberosum]
MSTIPPVNITEPCPPTPESRIDLNDPTLSFQPGPQPSVLSDYLFLREIFRRIGTLNPTFSLLVRI